MSNVYYSEYLQLDKILGAQAPESDKVNKEAHDEMLFIIVHQAYELWFKQILHEVGSVMEILNRPSINDNSPDIQIMDHRLNRTVEILKLLIQQIDVIETMTPLDFLDFRDLLRPASGFQSMQFKILEAKLGLRSADRFGKEYYVSQLKPHDRQQILDLDGQETLLDLVTSWLERMPYFDKPELWQNFEASENGDHAFWTAYRAEYASSLGEGESESLKYYDRLFMNLEYEDDKRRLSTRARRSALFIMLFRGSPMLAMPFRLINHLLSIDELMATWRYRHMNMVHRMIGHRVGTGGSTGKNYLKNALDSHYIFSEFAELTSYLVERSRLPKFSPELNQKLGFEV
jgi:tryptophan 2,3-dioxygenase